MLKRINKNKISKIILYSSLTISTSVNAYAAIVLKYFFNILVLGFVIGIGTAVFIDKIFTKKTNKDFDAKIALLISEMDKHGYEVKETETINPNDIIEISQYKVDNKKSGIKENL